MSSRSLVCIFGRFSSNVGLKSRSGFGIEKFFRIMLIGIFSNHFMFLCVRGFNLAVIYGLIDFGRIRKLTSVRLICIL